jgi:hypothetical protein
MMEAASTFETSETSARLHNAISLKRIHDFNWKPEDKRPLGRPRRRWEESIKMGVRGT